MIYRKIRIIVISMCLIPLILLCGCKEESKPEDTIHKMEKAFNNSDIETLLECYEPSVQNMYNGIMEIGGKLMDVDLKTVISGLGGFANLYGEDIGAEMPEIDITINNQDYVNDDKVKMNITMSYDYSEHEIPNQTMDIYVVNIDDIWYISAETP